MTVWTTNLVISGNGVPPYSARGLKHSFRPIAQAAAMARTVNGQAVDLSLGQFRKYAVSIQGQDQQPPSLELVWPGSVVTVDCGFEFCYPTATGSPQRPVVPGSSRVDGDYTFYRPRLTMIVKNFQNGFSEWAAENDWTLELEER